MKKRTWKRLAVFAMMAACLFGGAVTIQAKAAPAQLTLNRKSLKMQAGGKTKLKVAKVKPSTASKKVTWESSNQKVVTVSKSGVVKAKKRGTATVTATATAGTASARCKIKVVKKQDSENAQEDTSMMNIQVGDVTFTAKLANNSSASALEKKLKKGAITIEMSDYANFEKVGSLGFDLPRNDKQITTEPGDLILYQGNQFVIYYGTNAWNFTKLGKIQNATAKELKAALGKGDVTVTLSL